MKIKYILVFGLLPLFFSGTNEVDRPKIEPITILETKPITPIEVIIPDTPSIVDALIQVESRGNDSAVGDVHLGEPSIGVLQIRPIMVREINRILKLKGSSHKYKNKDRFSRDKSIEMFTIWKEFHHKDSDYEKIARSWNGGPKGPKNPKTYSYWKNVEYQLYSL